MSTVQELKKRADELRNKTAVNSITPDEVGSLIFDTIDYMYSIESSGIFKMMSALAETTNPSAADQIPVIGAEIAQKASITTVVGKGLQNAETQTEFDSVPVIRGTKVGQMAKSDIAVKLCESFEQNLPTYRPNTDTFDQIRIRKSETGESYYISKEDLAEVVGGLLKTQEFALSLSILSGYGCQFINLRKGIEQKLSDSVSGLVSIGYSPFNYNKVVIIKPVQQGTDIEELTQPWWGSSLSLRLDGEGYLYLKQTMWDSMILRVTSL